MGMSTLLVIASIVVAAGPGSLAPKDGPAKEVGARLYIHQDANLPGQFIPSGFMPDGTGIEQNVAETNAPHSGKNCVRVKCDLSNKEWVGVYFLLSGKWEPSQPFNLLEKLGAKKGDPVKCRFWARSADGAVVQFKVGGVGNGKVRDSLAFPAASDWLVLGPKWTMYEIDVTNEDMTSLVGGFTWTCDRAHNLNKNITFDIDDVYYVVTSKK